MEIRAHRIVILAALLGIAPNLPARAQQAGQVFDPTTLPDRVRMGAFSGKLRKGYQEARITFTADEKSVDLHWTSSALTNQEPDWGTYSSTAVLETNSREYSRYKNYRHSVSSGFYVTACGRLSDGDLVLAGVNAAGRTVVQKWTFVWPAEMPEPVMDTETWLDSVEIVVPGVQKSTVYLSPLGASPVKVITGITGLRVLGGAATKALLQYASPNDVYQLDLGSATLALLASETNGSGALGALTSLGIAHYSSIAVFDHAEHGYLYFFNLGSSAVSAFYGGAPVDDDDVRLHLVDGNRDGIIDAALQLSTNQAEATNYLDLDQYQNWWLE